MNEPATSKRPETQAVTERVHETSWSVNLEMPRHADSVDRILDDAIEAIEHTASGTHVNLVTHGSHGHPSTYLYEQLEEAFDAREVMWEYVDQCGCGGYVTRVHVA